MVPPSISPSRTAARNRLSHLEALRLNPQGRHVYWSARAWEDALTDLVSAEEIEDGVMRREIAQLRPETERQTALLIQLDATIQQDIDWYTRLWSHLNSLRETLELQGRADTPEHIELHTNLLKVELRIRQRSVMKARVALETLEQRREAFGHVGAANWGYCWDVLQSALTDEEAYYERVFGGLPAAEVEQRLSWLRQIQGMQDTAYRWWADRASFDLAGYEMASSCLAVAIERLVPPQPDSGGGGLGLLIVIGIIIAIIIGAGAGANAQRETTASPTTAAPELPPQRSASADANAAYDEGVRLLRAGNCDAAIAAFDRAFAADPDWHLPLNDKAFCAYELGQVGLAKDAWLLALDRNPSSPDAHAGLAMALLQSGEVAEAQDHYRRAVELDSRYRNAAWLRAERFWSARAIADSEPLRQALP